jgi:hypothetical protein
MYFYKLSLNYLREYNEKKLKIRFKCKYLSFFPLYFIFLNCFGMLILKINFFKIKNIILIYFQTKIILKIIVSTLLNIQIFCIKTKFIYSIKYITYKNFISPPAHD